jgi:hypothetical protein
VDRRIISTDRAVSLTEKRLCKFAADVDIFAEISEADVPQLPSPSPSPNLLAPTSQRGPGNTRSEQQ